MKKFLAIKATSKIITSLAMMIGWNSYFSNHLMIRAYIQLFSYFPKAISFSTHLSSACEIWAKFPISLLYLHSRMERVYMLSQWCEKMIYIYLIFCCRFCFFILFPPFFLLILPTHNSHPHPSTKSNKRQSQ